MEILDNILANEAEEALKNTGGAVESTGDDNLPPIEFYYGKVKQDGKWIKTGKIYWIYTIYHNGERKRVSPTKIYGKQKGITSIDRCPYEGRILEFRSRSLGFKYTGDSGDDGRFQRVEKSTAAKPRHQ